jgi:hypothetical protein
MRSSFRVLFLALFVSCYGFSTAAQAPSGKAVSIVGRNGKFLVIEPDGSASKLRTDNLKLLEVKRPTQATGEPEQEEAASSGSQDESAETSAGAGTPTETSGKEAPRGETAGTTPETSPESTQTTGTPPEETPEEKAVRAKDVSNLRMWRQIGGAYFYDESNKPVPFDEVDRRIATGEVEGIRVIGLQLQDWSPQTKSKEKAEPAAKAKRLEAAPAEGKIHPPLVYDIPYARLPEEK